MNRYRIDTSGISKMFDLTKSGRTRKVARLWYVNKMEIEEIAKAMGYGKSAIASEIMLINRLIENNIPCRICAQCGEKFYTTQKAQICPNCKAQNVKDRLEAQKEEYKSSNKPKTTTAKRKKFKSISVIEKERAIYNKEHNTLLSYGQYVALTGD